MLSRPGTITVGNRGHTLLDDGDVLLRGDHLGQNVSTAVVKGERGVSELTLSVLQGLAGRSRVVESGRNQSRKLHTGAGEWAVHTSALRAT